MSLDKSLFDMRHFSIALQDLKEHKQKLPLESMVRVATIYTPHALRPTFMFKEMLQTATANAFRDQVAPWRLSKLVDAILSRLQQHRVTFDHLHSSTSRMHSKY
jgi:hypothetical protein